MSSMNRNSCRSRPAAAVLKSLENRCRSKPDSLTYAHANLRQSQESLILHCDCAKTSANQVLCRCCIVTASFNGEQTNRSLEVLPPTGQKGQAGQLNIVPAVSRHSSENSQDASATTDVLVISERA